ncbi:hypothetical protein BH11VER1_BH11VER1_33680 [soil metagenome]
MKSRFCLLLALAALTSSLPLRAENEIGFIEKFALASDRTKVLGELVPGTDEYYFFHALHYQNTRDAAKFSDIMAQWKKRIPSSSKREIIDNREALLSYDADPQKTLQYLRNKLGVSFNHVQEVRDQKPNLPTTLDPALIARSVFEASALNNVGDLSGSSDAELVSLVRRKVALTDQQRRALLSRIQRPDVPNLVDLIILDLQTQESRGFGEFAIHRALLPEQLEALVTAIPALAVSETFVRTKMRKLAPSTDVNLEYDAEEREAWLERVWTYAKTLSPAFNTLKAQVQYQRLDHDRHKGVYDRERFLEYLKLPRPMGYISQQFLKSAAQAQMPMCDLNADLSEALLTHRPIGNDEPLVREYFLNLFTKAAAAQDLSLAPWTDYVRDTWLKPVFAEAMITSAQANVERWTSQLTPTAFQQLKDRVDIEFPATNAKFFQPGDDVQFDVIVKNTPKLLVKIYELNALNFFLTQHRQLNTDLNLDGLVANNEQTHTFETGPYARTRQTFKFPELKGKRGAWIMEFIGGGRSSRALVRTGQYQVLPQTGPAGDLLLVLDEKGEPAKDAVAWVDGRKLTVNEKLGRIVVPFTNQPGMKELVLSDAAGSFATLTRFEHHAENYVLDAQFHIEREQLLARREATLAVRTSLMLGEVHLDPALLIDPKLTITSVTHDGIATTREVKDLKLSAGSVLTQTIPVPERLSTLSVTLSAKVEVLSAGGEKRDVQAARSWEVNGIDKTEATNDGHLSNFDGQYVFELLGKNGEPLADQQVVFECKHLDFEPTQNVALRTDEKGRILLGKLDGLISIRAHSPNQRVNAWGLENYLHSKTSTLHVNEGGVVRIPAPLSLTALKNAEEIKAAVSLLEMHAGTFTADQSAKLSVRDGFLVIEGLFAGDYSLRMTREKQDYQIKITKGSQAGGWYLGKHRQLEAKGNDPLQIVSVTPDQEVISIKLANATPFTRVHLAASRFDARNGLMGGLGGFNRFGAAEGSPAKLPNLYAAGRSIGDEYRYILDRKFMKLFPGNMLTRPGLLLNPWEIRDTELEELSLSAGQMAGRTSGGAESAMKRAAQEATDGLGISYGMVAGAQTTNLDFLAASSPTIYNLIPDKDGIVRIERKLLGDRQHLQIYAEDLKDAVWRTLALPEVPTKFADQRLARNLDPAKPFTQKKEVTVLDKGGNLVLADILTSELETYDNLSSVHALFTTLSNDSDLAKFAWILQWPKLKDEEKLAKYSEFACHELSFFLAKKDPGFFDKVIKPYLANKKDKTFMDDFLLGTDLKRYLQPWAYMQLNTVEQALLAQRIEGEAPHAARHLRELWETLTPDQERQDHLFETALRGRALEMAAGGAADASGLLRDEKAKQQMQSLVANSAVAAPATSSIGDPFAAAAPAPASPRGMISSMKAQDMDKLAEMPAEKAKKEGYSDEERQRSMERKDVLDKSGAGTLTLKGGEGFGYFGAADAKADRAAIRIYYRSLGPTKEWAENNYYHLRITEQNADLITVNAFWRDYAKFIADGAKGPFLSPNMAEASRNFAEMMLALAVLDLPFEAAQHESKIDGGQFTFNASGPVIVYHKEIKPAAVAKADQPQLLVSQSFFRQSDRFRQEGNERFEKYVTEEFLTGAVYGANVVVTNPTSSPVKAEVLLQIPQGALTVLGSKTTNSYYLRLEPYTTKTYEYYFYFPSVSAKAGVKFAHFPVNVALNGANAASAKPFEFPVVARLTQVDKASWDYVSQYGTEAEALAFLEQNNVEFLDLERIAWRCRLSVEFFRKLISLLEKRHVWDDTLYSYALLHNDLPTLREWLKHHDDFLAQCGPWLSAKLLQIDPTERRVYEHLEYSPLVNQRAHKVGNEYRVANPAVLGQYRHLLDILGHKPQLDAADSMSVTYYLFLQDRTEEALSRFHAIDARALPTQLQHDYFKCYAAFYEENLPEARTVAAKYADYSVDRWKKLFGEVSTQLDEIEGKAAVRPQGDMPDREFQQGELASTEPAFEFKVENRNIALTWRNLSEVTVNYYLMDPEFSFSSNPFVSEDAGRFSIIKPTLTTKLELPKGKDAQEVALPAEFAKANVLVEIAGAGQRKTQAYHANTLKLNITENYGRLEVRDSGTDKALAKIYVKVYARLKNGTVRFFKDGYTDLRGRFDYASLNSSGSETPQPIPMPASAAPANGLDYQMLKPAELESVEKMSILVLSETHGASVKEVTPPHQ